MDQDPGFLLGNICNKALKKDEEATVCLGSAYLQQ